MSATENAAQAVQQALAHPYVKRVMEDAEIRDNARAAYESAREAYDQLTSAKHPINALFDEKKLQNNLKTAGAAFVGVRAGLLAKPKKRRWGRMILLAVVGGALAIALSEGLRNKVLDLMFGAEEEFDYVSTTAPPAAAPPAPAPAPAAAAGEAPADEATDDGDGAA